MKKIIFIICVILAFVIITQKQHHAYPLNVETFSESASLE